MNGPNCRWCNSVTDAEFVDVGVGMVQVTGGECWKCGVRERGVTAMGIGSSTVRAGDNITTTSTGRIGANE